MSNASTNLILDIAVQALDTPVVFNVAEAFMLRLMQRVSGQYTYTFKPESIQFDRQGIGQGWLATREVDNLWRFTPSWPSAMVTEIELLATKLPVLPLSVEQRDIIFKWVKDVDRTDVLCIDELNRGQAMYAILYALGMDGTNQSAFSFSHDTNWPEFKTRMLVTGLVAGAAYRPRWYTIAQGPKGAQYVQHGLDVGYSKANKQRLWDTCAPFTGELWSVEHPVTEGVRVAMEGK